MINISVLEIDLGAIKKNIIDMKSKLLSGQKFCMVAKADAYGFGAKAVCEKVQNLVDYFAVSSAKEFYNLITITNKPILILDPVFEDIEKLINMGAELTISSFESLDKVLLASKKSNKVCKVHIAINTGMNRFGFKRFIDIENVVKIIEKTQNVSILGVFSHYFCAKNETYAENQRVRLMVIAEKIKDILQDTPQFHLCSTSGVLCKNCFDIVRVGIGCYTDKFYQTVTLKSRVIDIQNLDKGECAGYDGVFVAGRKTKLAIIAIGYGDGLARNIVKKGYVLINNKKAKIVAICMDSMMADVTDINAKILDEVILIGRCDNEQIFICDVASWCDTIEYDIIMKLTSRVERKYIG